MPVAIDPVATVNVVQITAKIISLTLLTTHAYSADKQIIARKLKIGNKNYGTK